MEKNMLIGHFQKSSVIEYPGMVSGVVFTQGCNFRCPYCHNPELVEQDLFQRPVPEEEIFTFLMKRRGKLDAVSITGGEPTIQRGLHELMARVKDMGFLVKLDTNGSSPDILRKVIAASLVDYLAMDIKAPPDKYSLAAGRPCDTVAIASSVRIIMDSGVPYEFRTTLVNGLMTGEDVLAMAGMIRGASRFVLQRFVPSKHLDPAFMEAKPPGEEDIKKILSGLKGIVLSCSVR
jgi:pyruvate formate lyase activating enzyme